MDEYLPLETLEWCNTVLWGNGFIDRLEDGSFTYVSAGAFDPDTGERDHAAAYFCLRDTARAWVSTQQTPLLQESKKPIGARGWSGDATEGLIRAYEAAGQDPNEAAEDAQYLGS